MQAKVGRGKTWLVAEPPRDPYPDPTTGSEKVRKGEQALAGLVSG